jgi:hypothetical protein
MRSSNLWQGVVGFWSATAGPSGYRLLDRSGRGNHGTLTNMDAATDWVVDSGRYALDFDGSNDHVLTSDAAFASGANAFSVATWVRSNGFAVNNFGTPFSYGSVASLSAVILAQNGSAGTGQILVGRYLSNAITSTNAIKLLDWSLILLTYTGSLLTIYIDGVSGGTATVTLTTVLNSCRIGDLIGGGQPFGGRIAETIYWRRALSEGEGRQLYQIGRGGMLTPRRRRRAYSVATGLRRRLLLTGQV